MAVSQVKGSAKTQTQDLMSPRNERVVHFIIVIHSEYEKRKTRKRRRIY